MAHGRAPADPSPAGPSGAEAAEDDSPPEQSVVEMDPTGRWSRYDTVLGRGAFKTVFKGFDEEEGIEVAWNQVRVNEFVQSKEDRDRLFAEIRVLKQLKHKNIMTFYDSWLDTQTNTVNFITELFTSGTLRQYRKRHKHIDSEVLKRWAWQILCGLVYLHGHTPSIIHRDLKCDNIFINGSEGIVKIGDLGLATLLRARTAPQSVLGTPEFMAPELYDEEYDDRVDVYSFGMCLLELATLEYPYSECRNAAQIYRKVTLGVAPLGLGRVPTEELARFIALCIAPRERRPRARQLLKNPYFDSIRTEKCAARLSAEALANSGASSADLQQLLAEYPGSVAGSSVSRTSSETACELGDAMHAVAGEHRADSPPHLPDITLQSVPEEGPEDALDAGAPPPGSRPLSPALMPLSMTPTPAAPAALHVGATAVFGSMASTPAGLAGGHLGSTEWADAMEVLAEEPAWEDERGGALSEPGSDGSGASPCPADAAMLTGNRGFSVRGKLHANDDELMMRLRICQPNGPSKVVEFNFDLAADTAMSVAGEMIEEMSLSHEDARHIADAIRAEIRQLTEAQLSARGRPGELLASAAGFEVAAHAPRPSCDWDDAESTQLVRRRSLPQGGAVAALPPAPPPLHPSPLPAATAPLHNASMDGGGEEDLATPPERCDSDSSMLSCCNSGLVDGAGLGREAGSEGDSAAAPASAPPLGVLRRKRSPSGVLSPPHDEDRKFPLMKLFENLAEIANGAPGSAGPKPDSPFAKAVPPEAIAQPGLELQLEMRSAPSAAASEPLGAAAPLPRLRRDTADAVLLAAREFTDRGHVLAGEPPPWALRPDSPAPNIGEGGRAASAPVSKTGSQEASPVREHPGSEFGGANGSVLTSALFQPATALLLGNGTAGEVAPGLDRPSARLQRPSAKLDPELKEQRRRLACDAMSKMEFGCLQGLDRFGVARGCGNKAGPSSAPAKSAARLPLA